MADENSSSLLQIWEDLDMSTADDNIKFKVDIIEATLQTNSEQPMAEENSSSLLQILEDLDMSTADASMMFKVDITEETLQKHSLFIPHRVAVGGFDFLATGGPQALDILNEEDIWFFDIIYDPAADGYWLSKQWKLFSKYHKLKLHDTVWISVNKLLNESAMIPSI